MSELPAKPSRSKRPTYTAAWAVCVLTTLIYLGFKQHSYYPVTGDENIYYYMSKVMVEGKAYDLAAGDICIISKGQRFSYQNRWQESARLLLIHTPGFDLDPEEFEE